jgi:hypothetical protein
MFKKSYLNITGKSRIWYMVLPYSKNNENVTKITIFFVTIVKVTKIYGKLTKKLRNLKVK